MTGNESARDADTIARGERWPRNEAYPPHTVGYLMEPALAVFRPDASVGETVELLRTLIKSAFITYGYITDVGGKLVGIITMRDLLFADPDARLDELMLRDPFFLSAEMPLSEASDPLKSGAG